MKCNSTGEIQACIADQSFIHVSASEDVSS